MIKHRTMQQLAARRSLAVVLVDMQGAYVEDLSPSARMQIVFYQTVVLRYCADNNVPVVVLELTPSVNETTIEDLRKALLPIPRVTTIQKRFSDGFITRRLDPQLKRWDTDSLLVVGVNASECVWATAKRALNKGYEVITGVNLMADFPKCETTEEGMRWHKENTEFIFLET